MKNLTNQQRLFMDWTVIQDNNRHINASDAELEELHRTQKHRHRPEHDWDLNGQHLKKG